MMARQQSKPKAFNAKLANEAAKHLTKYAQTFITKLHKSGLPPQDFAVRAMGEQIASATNIALAIEIRLKVLWFIYGTDPPAHHDLWALFKRLPNNKVRRLLEESYNRTIASVKSKTHIGALEIALSTKPLSDDRLPVAEKSKTGQTLEVVLKVSKDAFQTWRYLYESAPADGGVRLLYYEYARLYIFSCVLDKYITNAFAAPR